MKKKIIHYIILFIASVGLIILSHSCKPPQILSPEESRINILEDETNFKNQYNQSTLTLRGKILNGNGLPIVGAEIQIDSNQVFSDNNGGFTISGLSRINRFMIVSAPGYRSELLPVFLNTPITKSEQILLPIILDSDLPGEVRFIFGGDTSFGRRFLDPSDLTPRGQMPLDNPDALIQVSNPVPGTQATLQFIKPYYHDADFSVVNLETPVTKNLSTPHPTKDYVYFTLPESLGPLKEMGIDYVSLGNNHLYDYLEIGVQDTIAYLDQYGIPHSGGSLVLDDAYDAYRVLINGNPYGLLSMTSISGRQHAISYVVEEGKGGAADLTKINRVYNAILKEINAGHIPIVQIHGGNEYTYSPNAYLQDIMNKVSKKGAALIISHHPHVAQGVQVMNGIPIVNCLGNFAFDQDRLETLIGLMARVHMRGSQVIGMRLIPIYLEDYRPRPISGDLGNLVLRRIGEFSGDNVKVFPYNNQGWVDWGQNEPPGHTEIKRTISVSIQIPSTGPQIIDLRQYSNSEESLSRVSTEGSVSSIRIGRDIMIYGDFEDWDTDGRTLEMARWYIESQSLEPFMSNVYRGTAAIASIRSSTNESDSVLAFRNRIRVMGDALDQPNKELSFFGYLSGKNSGQVNAIVRFYASTGDATFGEEEVFEHSSGSFDWEPMFADIHMPPDDPTKIGNTDANPRALRLFLHHSPPSEDSGMVIYDDIAIINWEEEILNGAALSTPHARDFLKIVGSPGSLQLTLEFTSYEPIGVNNL